VTVALVAVFSIMTKTARILGQGATEANIDLLSEINEGIASAKIVKR